MGAWQGAGGPLRLGGAATSTWKRLIRRRLPPWTSPPQVKSTSFMKGSWGAGLSRKAVGKPSDEAVTGRCHGSVRSASANYEERVVLPTNVSRRFPEVFNDYYFYYSWSFRLKLRV